MRARLAHTAFAAWLALLAPWSEQARAQPDDRVRILVAELGLSEDSLRWSDRAAESFAFAARADQLLTAAELELEFDKSERVEDLTRLDVLLNGEPLVSLSREQLAASPRRQIVLDASLLASTNLVTLRLRTTHDPEGCGRVPVGSWGILRGGALVLTSAPLPLPHDLAVLPLPFFDPGFDRAQVLHFVLTRTNPAQLQAASLVAGWFALQGKGRLSFSAHAGELPAENAVVFVEDMATARRLGLTPPPGVEARAGARERNDVEARAGARERNDVEARAGARERNDGSAAPPVALELRAHPAHSAQQLLVVWGVGEGGLGRAARTLLVRGSDLSGPVTHAEDEATLPELAPYHVPRWAEPGDVLLGALPERQPLRVEGGHSQSLRLRFRIVPDLFTWPSDHVELDLGYAQNSSPRTGPANVHLALNGYSLGMLPARARGRTTLRVPRSLLRGYNELALQVSYAAREDATCAGKDDRNAWVELTKDSRLKLGPVTRFALLPDLSLFLYDGFPFTLHGDLRETTVILPRAPAEPELSTLLGAVAHFASVTGHPPAKLTIQLGTPAAGALRGRDALLIAARDHHPLLSSWAPDLTLAFTPDGAQARYPRSSSRFGRYLAGHFDDGEIERAQRRLERGPFAAVMAVPAPWDEQRSLLVITASELARMPRISDLQGYAASERPESDLLLRTDAGRFLFQLCDERGRGALPRVRQLRFWLAHYWLLLIPLALLATLAWGSYAFHSLSALARRRLGEVDG